MTANVLIIGAGAIGGFYGSLLAKAGADVAVVCRSDYKHVKQHGFKINSHVLGSWTFTPSQILKNAAEYKGNADYVLLCTKVVPSVDRSALIRPAVTADTAIVFIQNGVEIEQEICRIADATEHRLPDNIIDINIENTYTIPPYKTSMLLDYENGHAMETEAILGNAVRSANRLGVTSPHLDSVYALMKLRELKLGL